MPARGAGSTRHPRRGAWWRARGQIIDSFARRELMLQAGDWLLKTDLYDEASGPYHHGRNLPAGVHWLGIDSDYRVARAAAARLADEDGDHQLVVCDVKALPFRDGSVAAVMSLSTLDHFESEREILNSLLELARILRPTGELRITLDNPRNPEVALRSRLPERIRAWLRQDQFPLGANVPMSGLRDMLEEARFEVVATDYLLHVPRYPTVRLARLLRGLQWQAAERLLRKLILQAERLSRWPSRGYSAHYIACRARKFV